MKQGWLVGFIFLLLSFYPVSAKELSQEETRQWMLDQQILNKVDELYQLVLKDEVDSLGFALQRLGLPQQDVVRFLLLENMEDKDIVLTPKMAKFVQKQLSLPSPYKIHKQGDGYEFFIPAFDSSAIASRLLKRWHGDQKVFGFILKAEQLELNLSDWLTEGNQSAERETLLIRELDSLSPKALDYLIKQITQTPVTHWLPSTPVVVRMAQVSEDPEVYKILWRLKADRHSQSELTRLANVKNHFSFLQLIIASENPSLHDEALNLMTRLDPIPIEIKTFLIKKLKRSSEATLVASSLIEHGHKKWLMQLTENHRDLRTKPLLQVLSAVKDK